MDDLARFPSIEDERFASRATDRRRPAASRDLADDEHRDSGGEAARAARPDPPTLAMDFPAVISLASLDGSNGFRLDGAAMNDNSGFSVSSAGDVNGDGIDDVIIGAHYGDPGGRYTAGYSYVVFGKTGGWGASLDLASLDGLNGFRLDGIDPIDRSGRSVSDAGDVNGDGFDDIIIGASQADPGGDGSAGESYVVFGKAGGFAASFSLSSLDGGNGFRLDGLDAYDYSGTSVSSAGDVNGDGFEDIIIGAPGAAGTDGEGYVVFGKAGGFAPSLNLASLDGSNGFRLAGSAEGSAGFSVSSAGDINGDGFDDIIIGAPRTDFITPGGQTDFGASYVMFGKLGEFAAIIPLFALNGTNGFRLLGRDAFDQCGYSAASAGDVNGDGFDDFIVGAFDAESGNGIDIGETYVFFGKAAGWDALFQPQILNGANGFRLDGISAGDRSGRSVSAAGDVNGDGFDDVIVGAPEADAGSTNRGQSYIVFGKAAPFSQSFDLDRLDGTNGFRLDGLFPTDNVGQSVSAAGDINDDGFDDIIVGAPGFDPDSIGQAGASYVLFGRAPTSAVLRVGSAADQAIYGGAFNDTLEGLGGADTLVGGDGVDVAAYLSSSAKVTVDLATGVGAGGDAAGDALSGIEHIDGSNFADRLFGDALANNLRGFDGNDSLVGRAGADTLRGLDDNDTLTGGAGADRLQGGAGIDIADYTGSAAVNVDIGPGGAVSGGDAAGDDLSGIENLSGSSFGDTLAGNNLANLLRGRDGRDSLTGRDGADTLEGGAGADTLDGGANVDTADYTGSGGGVNVDLKRGVQVGGEAEGDVLSGIENVTGSAGADTLSGDLLANLLSGGKRNDALAGGQGNDTLDGGSGADTLTGSGGADRFVLTSKKSADAETITDFAAGDQIALAASVYGLPAGALAASAFRKGTAAADADDRIIWDKVAGMLYFDADGNGAGAQVLIAAVSGVPPLGTGDFVVI